MRQYLSFYMECLNLCKIEIWSGGQSPASICSYDVLILAEISASMFLKNCSYEKKECITFVSKCGVFVTQR